MKIRVTILLTLIFCLALGLKIHPHEAKDSNIQFNSIFNTFWAGTDDDVHAMFETLLNDEPQMLKAVQRGKVIKRQDQKLRQLVANDDELRTKLIQDIPQLRFLQNFQQETQIELFQQILKAMSYGNQSPFLEVILSNEESRNFFMNQIEYELELMGMEGFVDLSQEEQDGFFSRIESSQFQEAKFYASEAINDPQINSSLIHMGDQGEDEFYSIFNSFWSDSPGVKQTMAERILGDKPELLEALKSENVNKEQDEQLRELFTDDDDLREQLLEEVPQFSFMKDYDKKHSIEIMQKILKAMSYGDMHPFLRIVLSNEYARKSFLSMICKQLESKGFLGFKNIDRGQQNVLLKAVYGSEEEQQKYGKQVNENEQLSEYYRALGGNTKNLSEGSHLFSNNKHQNNAR